MIISQTPFRVSFAGGGTDLPAFYDQEYGAVLSVALRRHMYVTIHGRFESNIRVSYSKTETVSSVDDLAHELVREAMRVTGTTGPVEVTTVADVPAGTGMGSSSALTIGLLNAMYAHQGSITNPAKLAEEACQIEIERLGHPIGKQDQYASAFGGMNYVRFNPDQTVDVEPVPCRDETLAEIESHSLMLYTAHQRNANEILEKQSRGTGEKRTALRAMRDLADAMRHTVTGETDLRAFASLLHEGWALKRSLGFGISNDLVDNWYDAARRAGAWGGKLLGAGSGGFLYLFAPPGVHGAIRAALGHPQELPFRVEPLGSHIVFISRSE